MGENISVGKQYTPDELNQLNKSALITLFLSNQEQMVKLNQNMELLIEQISIANQKRFGRKSEKQLIKGQMDLSDYDECFNEAEKTTENLWVVEPLMEDVGQFKNKKQPGKREEDLKKIAAVTTVIEHDLPDDKLREIFGTKWKRLPDEVYKRLAFHPATYEVLEHHVAVYAGYDNQTIVKADRPADLLRNSIATPSLVAAIMNAKYVNAVPLYRLSQEFARNEVKLSRQVMSNWTLLCAERYLSLVYERFHEELLKCPVLQADETTVSVSKDGRAAGSNSYMCYALSF